MTRQTPSKNFETLPPSQILREIFLARKKKNHSYSTRSFARDLGVSQTYISLILSGKRKLAWKRAVGMCHLLRLTDGETESFLKSVSTETQARPWNDTFLDLDLEGFKAISRWYHLAILDLTLLASFKPDFKWIAAILGITAVEVRDAVDRLQRLKLLEIKEGRWIKTNLKIYFPTKNSVQAVRSFHEEMINKALLELSNGDDARFKAREISGMTIAVNPARIPQVKKLIMKFQKELTDLAGEGPCTSLYQLNVQFFSLLKSLKGE